MPKTQQNPFELFDTAKEVTIKVKELGNQEVTIKTSMTVAEQLKYEEILFKNQTVSDTGMPSFNMADRVKAETFAVSAILVNPKMDMSELMKLNGADKAISEIFDKYGELHRKKEGK